MSRKEKELILNRSKTNIWEIKGKVKLVLEEIRENGNKAVIKYTERFDAIKLRPCDLRVSKEEIKKAFERTDAVIISAIKQQIKISKKFAKMQLRRQRWQKQIFPGLIVGQKTTPIESVGLYVPGGAAPLPTVMQILAVPAKLAGVKKIVVCTPPRENIDVLLVAAELSGVDEIYRIGGIQAIGTMAYGTETIPKVQKIVGPGNIWVTAAKEIVFGEVAIDMPAGPSEAIILADGSAKAEYVAADILARAEHDTNAAGVLATPSKRLALEVVREIEKQRKLLQRKEIINGSLQKYSAIIITQNLGQAIRFVNEYAPEHLEIITNTPWKVLDKIENAGSIFLGANAPVAAGDYASGVNHVLPTGGNAKMFSAVGIETFQKKSEFEYLTKGGLRKLKRIVEVIADVEGLQAHKKSVQIRFEEG